MRPGLRSIVVSVVALLLLAVPGSSWAGGPGAWTKLATVDNGFDAVGMLRTANGALHLVWLAKRASNLTHSYGTSTISRSGKLLATGTALSNWGTLEPDPQLVSDGAGMRLVFEGNVGTTGCFALGEVFTETSADGSTWNLVLGSMDSHSAGVGNLAATAESNGTPLPGRGPRRHDHADSGRGPIEPGDRNRPGQRLGLGRLVPVVCQAGILGQPDPSEPGRAG